LYGLIGPVVATLSPSANAQAPTAYTLEAPREIRTLLDQLRKPAHEDSAIAALAANERTGPYLAFEQLAALAEDHKEALGRAQAAVDAGRARRNQKRAAKWIVQKRIDLCVEHLIACPDDRTAIEFIDGITPLLHDIGRKGAEELKIGFGGGRPSIHLPDHWARTREFPHFSGKRVEVRLSHVIDGGVVRADRFDSRSYASMGALVAVRSSLRHPPDDPAEWVNSVVLANCSIPLRSTEGSLIISDGDVEIDDRIQFTTTIVIARGNITGTADAPGSPGPVYLAAGGDINLRVANRERGSLYAAGGSVRFAGQLGRGSKVLERVMNPLLGLRFLDLAEFGVEVDALKEGVKVKHLAAWSPLATHELRIGDVIRSVNGVDVKTPAAFRHELRRAIPLEHALLCVERDREHLTRIVFLDGIPIDPTARIAPSPSSDGCHGRSLGRPCLGKPATMPPASFTPHTSPSGPRGPWPATSGAWPGTGRGRP
jgi:hypothetical protein